MSKWLRRGFAHNNVSTQDEQRPHSQAVTVTQSPHHHQHQQHTQSEFPSPPRNAMPGSASAAVYHSHHQTSPMGTPYGSPTPATIAMDIDNPPPSSRTKYSSSSNYHPHASTSGKSNLERSRDDVTPNASRSRRSIEADRRSRNTPPPSYRSGSAAVNGASNANVSVLSNSVANQQHPSQPQYSIGTPQNVPPSSAPYHHQNQNQYHPPQATPNSATSITPYKQNAPLGTTTPPDAVQPSYPPPAVTAESPPLNESAQRRPAYLLHRDLVIGKGSYGQVCIASRGEPEGHSSGRQGKRKKFACKCVMLRNDPKYIAKLQEEVNVLRELRGHDNVIRLYDVFCVDNELFIITELGRGGDLFHLLTTHPKHGVTEAYAGKLFAYKGSAACMRVCTPTHSTVTQCCSQNGRRNAFSCGFLALSQHLSPRLETRELGFRVG
jgi:Protein kinase domain